MEVAALGRSDPAQAARVHGRDAACPLVSQGLLSLLLSLLVLLLLLLVLPSALVIHMWRRAAMRIHPSLPRTITCFLLLPPGRHRPSATSFLTMSMATGSDLDSSTRSTKRGLNLQSSSEVLFPRLPPLVIFRHPTFPYRYLFLLLLLLLLLLVLLLLLLLLLVLLLLFYPTSASF